MAFLLHQLLSQAARRDPAHEAVQCDGRSLSYGELDAAANGVANALIDQGVRRGDRVGIYLPKRVEMVAAVYGALRSGAAYVPLDPKSPVRRVAMVASDCAVKAIITTPGRAAALLEAMGEAIPASVVLIDDGTGPVDLPCPSFAYERATADADARDPAVPMIEMDVAYILYTSGSTGVPKGVMLTHRNALVFVEWSAAAIGIRAEDRVSNHAPLHFDLSVFDLYLSALGGATVVLIPEESAYMGMDLVRLIRDEQISVWYSVPSALMLVTRAMPSSGALDSLRTVVFAGEVYPTKHLRALKRLLPRVPLWNIYGPTETNVVTYYRVQELPEDDRTIPIGRACQNAAEVFALKEDGSMAGIGEEGELHVRGPTVMKGYWGQPEKTAEVLVPDPRPGRLGDPVYRTGDLVRLRSDGEYDFLGRRDHQIKRRGYRIELGEIESALGADASLAEAVVVAIPHEEWGKAVIAYVVPREGEVRTVNQIKRSLVTRIPRYMIPDEVQVAPALPRTSNGKVDRQRLVQAAMVKTAPRTPTEPP